jgi:hypothetical protein
MKYIKRSYGSKPRPFLDSSLLAFLEIPSRDCAASGDRLQCGNNNEDEAMKLRTALLACLLLTAIELHGQDFSKVPGVAIGAQLPPPEKCYLSSASLVVLPDGGYAACHDLFGKNSNDRVSGTTKVYYSADKGAHWTLQATVADMHQGGLFYHDALYLFGYTKGGGNIAIRKSTDNGLTWTTAADSKTGLLRAGRFGGTPGGAVVHGGRIWVASNNTVMSAPADSDLLDAANWSWAAPIKQNPEWLGGKWTFWSEGQVVASPQTGVVLMPKTDGLPYVGTIKAVSPDKLSFDPDADFAAVPGAEKKFGAKYDPVSKKFYILDNPVLPAHYGRTTRALTRTAAAMLSSKDLRHWDVEKIFLFTPNIDDGTWGEAFQYFSFDFDGDDLVLASRTSFPVGDYRPPRGHDSNLLTFHRIENFRAAAPEHFLSIDAERGRVLRFETTQHADAPLGEFALGRRFDGKPIDGPTGIAQDAAGDVYIAQRNGRVLRFDAFGNFLGTVESSPAPLVSKRLPLAPPPPGECVWVRSESNDWDDPMNWFYWRRPDAPGCVASFGSAIDDDATIHLERAFAVGGLRFRSAAKYAIDGSGQLFLESGEGAALVDSQLGNHDICVPVSLRSDAEFCTASGASITFSAKIDLGGKRLSVRGPGKARIGKSFEMHGGVLSLDGRAPLVFSAEAEVTLDGALQFSPPEGTELAAGKSFRLFEETDCLRSKSFRELQLPSLKDGLAWDSSKLYSEGTLTIVSKSR